jgi:hypothetical protein
MHPVLSRDLNKVRIIDELNSFVDFEGSSRLELELLSLILGDNLLDSIGDCMVLTPQIPDCHISSSGKL